MKLPEVEGVNTPLPVIPVPTNEPPDGDAVNVIELSNKQRSATFAIETLGNVFSTAVTFALAPSQIFV